MLRKIKTPSTIVMENAETWYLFNPLSKKRIAFALLYYFFVHLFILPIIWIVLLGFLYDPKTAELYAQAASDICNVFVFLIIFLPFLEESWQIFRNNIKFTFIHSLKWYIPMLLSNAALTMIIIALTGLTQSNNQEAVVNMYEQSFLAIAIPSILVAPLVEELIFRGIIFRSFRKFGFLPAALVSSLSFGFLHVIISLMTKNYADMVFILLYGVMAFYFCLTYEKTKNIFGCYILHLVNNVGAILAMGLVGIILK